MTIPRSHTRSLTFRYGSAMVASGVALVLWFVLMRPAGRDALPVFLAATALAAWFGCVGPGILTALIASCVVLFGGPTHGAVGSWPPQYVDPALLVLVAVTVGWSRHASQRRRSALGLSLDADSTSARNPEEGICTIDGRGRLFSLNAAGERLLAWTESDLRGKPLHAVLHRCTSTGAQQNDTACPLDRLWRSGLPYNADDDLFWKGDGTTLSVSYSMSPIYSNGRVAGALLAFRDITEQKRKIAALQASKERYAKLIETSPDGIVVTDIYSYVVMANGRAAELYGFESSQTMIGMHVLELIDAEDRVRATRDKRRVLDEGSLREMEYLGRRQDGSVFPSEVSTSLVLDPHGKPEALYMVTRDRTEQKEHERVVRQTEKYATLHYAATSLLAESRSFGAAIPGLLKTICEGAGWQVGVLWTVGQHDDVLRCSSLWHSPELDLPRFETLTRQLSFVPGRGIPGRVWQTGKPLQISDVVADPEFTRALAASQEGIHGALAVPVRLDRKVHAVIELFSCDVRPPDAEMMHMMETLSVQVAQFVKRRQAEEALEHAAYHDPLTNLANRSLFKGRMDRAILSAWSDHLVLAILLMDLNKFKEINDTYGHQCGDIVLQRTATRLRHGLRDSDTVARLGGDEFAVLLPGTDEQGARVVATKIVETLTEPIAAGNLTLEVGTSIGIAMYPRHGEDSNTLLQHADVAMYTAKNSGGGFRVYNSDQELAFQNRRRA